MKVIKYIIGNPSSGKSCLLNKFLDDFSDNGKIQYISDSNNYKDYSLIKEGYTSSDIHNLSVKESYGIAKLKIMNNESFIIETTLISFMENIDNVRKIKARGYFVEVYLVLPNFEQDLKRNKTREFPTPLNRFYKCPYNFLDFEKYMCDSGVDYFQSIDYSDIVDKDSIYKNLKFYKSSKNEYVLNEKIMVKGDVKLDINAIHYSKNKNDALLYHKENLYEVRPIGRIYKYGKIFYSKGVSIVKKL